MADDEIELESGATIPVYNLPVGPDYLIDEPDESIDQDATKAWAGEFVAEQSREAYERFFALRGDLMAKYMAQYEEPLLAKVVEAEARHQPALEQVVDLAFTVEQEMAAEAERDATLRLAHALTDAAVRRTGMGGVTPPVEIQPGVWRFTVETNDMVYEIEVRGRQR